MKTALLDPPTKGEKREVDQPFLVFRVLPNCKIGKIAPVVIARVDKDLASRQVHVLI